eukprot:TRINITY_DN6216_c1_g1_i1.p1 TRINITY_DN6216_c1_g1~~TRINITY_DN6216_c1_g1_i1.p1  ORF type:complete len:868 (+),score=129.67 TRINITY_DN6216_c1_g1_i1:138-2741(+)
MAPIPFVWYYRVSDNQCLPFPDEASRELERQYELFVADTTTPSRFTMRSGKYAYTIDLHRMTQENQSTRRTRALERLESPLATQLRNDMNGELDTLKRQLSEISENATTSRREFERERQLKARLQEQTRALEETLRKERLSASKDVQELQELKGNIARLRQASAAKEQQAAAHQRQQEQKFIEEKEILERRLQEAEGASKELEGWQWQFYNHLEKWQPYDVESNTILEETYSNTPRPRGCKLSDRYEVDFMDKCQINHRSGMRRDIRRVQAPVVDSASEAELRSKEAEFVKLHEQHHAVCQQLNSVQEELASARTIMKDRETHHAETSANFQKNLIELNELITEKSMRIVEMQSAQENLAKVHSMKMSEITEKLSGSNAALAMLKIELQASQDNVAKHRSELKNTRKELTETKQLLHAATNQDKDKEMRDLKKQVDQELSNKNETIASLREDLGEMRRANDSIRIDQMFGGSGTESQRTIKELEDQLSTLQEQCRSAHVEAQRKTAHAEAQRMQENLTKAQKELKEYKDSTKKEQAALQKEKQAAETQIKRLRENQAMLVASILTKNYRLFQQQRLMDNLPPRADAVLRDTSVTGLVDTDAKNMLQNSADMRKNINSLHSDFLEMFGDLPEPEVIEEDGPAEVQLLPESPEFKLIEHMMQASLTEHRLNFGSDEWCDKPRLKIHEVVMMAWSGKAVRLYRKERERILKRDLPEACLEMEDAIQPVVPKDANEFFLFHGCPWEAAKSISTQGFDWKHRGTNQGCMFGQGTYFAPNASKCDLYSDKDTYGHKCMFLARVLLGASVPRWKKCTDVKSLGKDFDSILAITRRRDGSVDHPEACIFQKLQALPAFKIKYSHEATCKCNLCLR